MVLGLFIYVIGIVSHFDVLMVPLIGTVTITFVLNMYNRSTCLNVWFRLGS